MNAVMAPSATSTFEQLKDVVAASDPRARLTTVIGLRGDGTEGEEGTSCEHAILWP